MADYRYYFYDISTKRLIDTLPMEEVNFGWELRGVGTLSGNIPLYADDLPAQRVREAVLPYRTKVFVERGGQLVWGGWINEEPGYDSSSGVISIKAEESLGYFANRTMPTVTYTQVDQLPMACSFIATAQADPGGDFWIHTDPTQLSGRLRDRSYSQFDQSPVLTALTQLSEVIDGFDFTSQVIWVGGMPYESLVLGYPRLGRITNTSGVVFEFDRFVGGGNVESYTWADAGTPMATKTWANTETDEGVQLTAHSDRPDLIADGYPIMEYSESFDGITNFSTLQEHADALATYRAGPRITAQFTVKAQPGLEIGDFLIGDDVLVRISDWRFPPDPASGAPGFIGYLRITGCNVRAGVEGEEEYQFTCADFISSI
ncbi:hypothetical protein [Microbispora sp. NPDC049125]|uniref:hypothetical protein n=1 Tax=Microbispora sp. NPDC049125 TaxID=3154929 RepID=UPI0034654AEC